MILSDGAEHHVVFKTPELIAEHMRRKRAANPDSGESGDYFVCHGLVIIATPGSATTVNAVADMLAEGALGTWCERIVDPRQGGCA